MLLEEALRSAIARIVIVEMSLLLLPLELLRGILELAVVDLGVRRATATKLRLANSEHAAATFRQFMPHTI